MTTMDAGDTGIDKAAAAESLPAVWQCVDRVYCISLTERTDRQASARAQFAVVHLVEISKTNVGRLKRLLRLK